MTVLFIGLGRMGAPMVRRHAARHATVVFDVDPALSSALADEVGCPALASLAELPDDIGAVILMLPDSRVVESVLLDEGLLSRLPAGSLVIDMGSSEPSSTRRLCATAQARGVGYVDAPVSGGVAKATSGELAIMVGGAPSDVDRARPHLEPLGTSILAVGGPGAGHAAKALNNLLSASNLAAAAEVLTVARTFGIEPAVMVDVLNASTGRSQATEVKYPRHVLSGTYDSGFALDLMVKDLGIASALARDQGAHTPVVDAAFATARRAREELGGAGLDHTEVARYYQLVNGVSLCATDEPAPETDQEPEPDNDEVIR